MENNRVYISQWFINLKEGELKKIPNGKEIQEALHGKFNICLHY